MSHRDYDHWDEVFRRLHGIVDNEQMGSLPIEELRRTVLGELDTELPAAEPAGADTDKPDTGKNTGGGQP